jgi:hypothetical protein
VGSASTNAGRSIRIVNPSTGVAADSRLQLVSDTVTFDIIASSSTYTNVASWIDAGILSTDANASGGLVLNAQAGGIKFQTGTTERMRITSGGDVGIGKDAPTCKLQVETNAASNFHSFFANVNSAGYGVGFVSYSGVQVYFYDTGGNIGSITSNGTNTSYNTSGSDERLKENIEVWDENVLDKFKDLQPKTFKFIKHKQNNKTVKGYIAQNEVDNFPEAYPMVYDIDAKEDMYQFNPSGMTVYLMKAIQELTAKVEMLEKNCNCK